MLRFACLALFVAVACGLELKTSLNSHWENFKSAHNKSYSSDEEVNRKEIFRSKVQAMLEQNLKADLGLSFHKLQINEFSDMSDEEFRNKMLDPRIEESNFTVPISFKTSQPKYKVQVPANRDWSGYMGPVKNQGFTCASCWAFMVTGVLEGYIGIVKRIRVTLSEQQLIDCSTAYGNGGCIGGNLINGMNYIIGNGGISSDTCYRYEEKQGSCRYKASCNKAQVKAIEYVTPGDENAILEVVGNIGPVAVSFDAMPDLSQVGSGIYTSSQCNKTKANHGVIIVGYGTLNGIPYWLCKNSWGTRFGQNGYFKIRKGTNECGIANHPYYPIV